MICDRIYYRKEKESVMYNILVCDDERDIVSALEIYLTSEGYSVVKAYNGDEALAAVRTGEIHLVLLDIMMPVMDGLTTMRHLREFSNVPVLLLTAKSEDADKIAGLNLGADDYITKPFNPTEVAARVRANLRRYKELGASVTSESGVYASSGIVLNEKAHTVTRDGDSVLLTPTEFDILKLFMTHPNEIMTPSYIYLKVWGNSYMGSESVVAVHIRHLREKIEYNPSEPRHLCVVWGQGYKFVPDKR